MATKKYDFNKNLIEWDGKISKDTATGVDLTLSKELAKNILYGQINNGDIVLKYFGWGNDLNTTGILDLDDADKKTLSDFILSHPMLPIITKGQLMKVFEEPKGK